jgi:hypothetical protein
MIRTLYTSLVLSLLLTSTAAAGAASLKVKPASPHVQVETFEYRRVATRNWLGCWHWDVLQGTGWFRATWYHLIDLVAGDKGSLGELALGWYEWYCGAQIDQYNAVTFTWTDPADATRVYRGAFSIAPDSDATSDVVGCELVAPDDEWNALSCTTAHAALDDADITIVLELPGLP